MDVLSAASIALQSIGLNLASNGIYDILKSLANETTKDKQKEALENYIRMHGLKVNGESILIALSDAGIIDIRDTRIYANNSAKLLSGPDGKLVFTEDSSIATPTGAGIVAERDARLEMGRNATFEITPTGDVVLKAGSA